MEVIYGLIPGMLLLGLVAVGVLFWAARSGQFDDLEGDGQRILMDEDADVGESEDARRFPDAETDRHSSARQSAVDGQREQG
ncbi:MAG: cbb3-type cytochrome oxidase assembly protein CcoS [Lamprobacter sp.]|uniref:cbb3-type cytochrome oxidase assembly protein CcoS n=1 Tax=Lamprobacter sp. TaxID=3100796 RepID=UPI002B25E6B5|nr:cbb3-type cytochrome oxidase assembly protein CcoS [Lamprobacter sp.]MEA3640297.1 cbb3-type cytochrome oxidase assembly protein CcoS [Lamprobacter sp.]